MKIQKKKSPKLYDKFIFKSLQHKIFNEIYIHIKLRFLFYFIFESTITNIFYFIFVTLTYLTKVHTTKNKFTTTSISNK
jgi:hypothetical protein